MKEPIAQPFFLSIPKAAKLCGVSRNTLYTWVRKGAITAYQTPGRTNLIRPVDLVRFMQESGLFIPTGLQDLAQRDEENDRPITGERPNDQRVGLLIADDDETTRKLLVRALDEDYKLFQAETGFEALHVLTLRKEIKIILLDLRMPGRDGVATLEEINTLRPDARVVIITGFADELPEDVVEKGWAVDVLEKPLSLEFLKKTLQAIHTSIES